MTEQILLLTIGLLVGGILTYAYMRKQGIDLASLLTDSMLKNHLLKEELGKNPSIGKPKYKAKKKYYANKKKPSSSKE
tara:strand:+ start:9678 stop:9911 length:234 start_codon:yes stop_codon:yes gene_type:complete